MSKKITEIKNILNDAADFKWLAFRLTDTGSNSIGKKFYVHNLWLMVSLLVNYI